MKSMIVIFFRANSLLDYQPTTLSWVPEIIPLDIRLEPKEFNTEADIMVVGHN